MNMLVMLAQLAKQPPYRKQIANFINLSQGFSTSDIVNLQAERSVVMFSPHEDEQDSTTPPFYRNLLIHDLMLHNFILDSGTSRNLMPLSVMKQLNLQITKPYKYLYCFDSN